MWNIAVSIVQSDTKKFMHLIEYISLKKLQNKAKINFEV